MKKYTITLQFTDPNQDIQVETLEFDTYQAAADKLASIACNNAVYSETNKKYVRYDVIALQTVVEGE